MAKTGRRAFLAAPSGLISAMGSTSAASAAAADQRLAGFRGEPPGVIDADRDDAVPRLVEALTRGGHVVVQGRELRLDRTLLISAHRCVLEVYCPIYPTFDGDVIRITGTEVHVFAKIIGHLQPRIGPSGAAFVVGYGGAPANQCSLAFSDIVDFYGDGLVWEHGSMLYLASFSVTRVTGDGIRCTSNFDDNNHGYFANTHLTRCKGIGYNVSADGKTNKDGDNPLFSRHHHFSNAKAFACGQNFFIGTIGNVGTVFSELGLRPDEFGPKSRGNRLSCLETRTSFEQWIDLGKGNDLDGYSGYRRWDHKSGTYRKLSIGNRFEGQQDFFHVADNNFADTISDTVAAVKVHHLKGSASHRVDVYDGTVEFNALPGTMPLRIGASSAGSFKVVDRIVEPRHRLTFDIPSRLTGAGKNSIALCTLAGVGSEHGVRFHYSLTDSGAIVVAIENGDTNNLHLHGVRINWAVICP